MTRIEIRSDAQVVRRVFIHGTGVVIVALDHGMTLAGAGKEQGAHHPAIGDHTIIGGSVGKHHPGQETPYRSPVPRGCGMCLTHPRSLAFRAAPFSRMAGACWLIPSWTMILDAIFTMLHCGQVNRSCTAPTAMGSLDYAVCGSEIRQRYNTVRGRRGAPL